MELHYPTTTSVENVAFIIRNVLDGGKRIRFGRAVFRQLGHPDKANAAGFGIDRDQSKQIADLLAFEEIAKIKKGYAKLLERAGDAREGEMAARQDDLFAVRDA